MLFLAIAYVMTPVLMGIVAAGRHDPDAFERFITGRPLTAAQSGRLGGTFIFVVAVMSVFMLLIYLTSSP